MNNPVSQRVARGVGLARIVGCCLLLVVERSSAFVMSGAGPCQATVSGVRGTFASSFLSVSSMLPLSSRPSLASWSSRRSSLPGRTRRTRLAMEVAVNPVSSRQYGKEDGKDGAGEHLINEDITVETVRCFISVKGLDEPLGVMPTSEALQRAEDEGLDLVMISPGAEPPVVKIIDYGKFKYKTDKKKKDSKAKHKATEMKEVKMSYKIEQHDYGVRLKNTKKFLSSGNRVRIIVQFRGREQTHMDLGNVLLQKVTTDLTGIANAEPKRREGNRLTMILIPKP